MSTVPNDKDSLSSESAARVVAPVAAPCVVPLAVPVFESGTGTVPAPGADIKIVIVMATYNRQNGKSKTYLARSIQSIMNQSHANWDLIVVGDKYKPEQQVLNILDRYRGVLSEKGKSNKIIFISNDRVERDLNIKKKLLLWHCAGANSINKGLKYARDNGYKYYAHIDDDDYWLTCHLQELAEVYAKYPNCVVAFTNSQHTKRDLPGIDIGVYPNNLLPQGGQSVHSALSFRLDRIPFTYNTPLNADPEYQDIRSPSDGLMLNRIKHFVKTNQEYCSIYISKKTCIHEIEGEARASG